MNFQIHNHMDTSQAYDLIVTLIKFNLELRDRVWPCSAIACNLMLSYKKGSTFQQPLSAFYKYLTLSAPSITKSDCALSVTFLTAE